VLTPDLLARLQTPAGEGALQAAAAALEAEPDFLRAAQRLTRRFDERLARAAVEQVQLRRRAGVKFSRADSLFFTQEALEQATSEAVARHRAARFEGWPRSFDLGCGIGGDALELARRSVVVAVDRDPLRLRVLSANASRLGLSRRLELLEADLHHLPLRLGPEAVAFCDPARRSGGRRLHRVANYEPALSFVVGWASQLAGLAIKVSPAVRYEDIERLDCEIEFVSLAGELKEAVLWFGVFRQGTRRATVLPAGVTLTGEREPDLAPGPIGAYLLEPDPAVLRAGLVKTLGVALEARPIEEDIAFLSADQPRRSPFVRIYRVLEASPFRLKSLQAVLERNEVGRVTVKRRGSAVEPEAIARRLDLHGDGEALVILTRHAGKQTMILAERLP
jgi:SAM-dependent methyltransferase